MDFKTLMSQIHESPDDGFSVDDIIAMSAPADAVPMAPEEPVEGLRTDDLRDFMVDYLDAMAFGGVSQAQYDLVEVDNISPRQLVELAESYGVSVSDFMEESRDA